MTIRTCPALKNRIQRERTEEQVSPNECYQTAKSLAAESKQYYESQWAEVLKKVPIAREAESRLEALR